MFETLYKQLNPAQKEAVDSIEGPVMVIAGPGTGKTTVLTLRIANILKETDTPPEAILAMTFTESGAYNMRRKLADIIGPAAYKVNIHTFHGFASKIIEEYPDYFGRIIGSKLITEPEQMEIVKKIISSRKIKLLRPYGDEDYYVVPILKEIQILKRENISPKTLKASLAGELPKDISRAEEEKLKKRDQKNNELAMVYEAYQKALEEQKLFDFDDMLLELIRSLEEEPEFKLILEENFQYILADEHQDANAAQNRILELLSDFHDSPNLFIVGDEKQAIYRFQGASLENFLFFSKKYADAKVIDLVHNYRSHQGILDAAHSLISKNAGLPGHQRKKLLSLQMGSAPILVTECESFGEELDFVAFSIEHLLDKAEAGDIAVLYRDNSHAEDMAKALARRGVPYVIESDSDILREPEISKILILCEAINDLSCSETLAAALFLPEMMTEHAHVAEICKKASKTGKPLYLFAKDFEDTAKAYDRLQGFSEEASYLGVADFFQKLVEKSGILEKVFANADAEKRLNTITEFHDKLKKLSLSRKTFRLRDFLKHLEAVGSKGMSGKRHNNLSFAGVRLMTAHRAKGLEFRHVFIIHAMDGIWGNRFSRNLFSIPVIEHARPISRLDDERRLFYVALTRARESVHVTYALSDGERDFLPCQFISEIDGELIDFDRLAEEEARPLLSSVQKKKIAQNQTLLDAAYVRAKFLAQPLSVTHVNNYLECPWKYFFVNLVRIPQTESKHQMYGTAMHATLKAYFDSYKQGRELSLKNILRIFKHALDQRALAKEERLDSYVKGEKALGGYIKTYNGLWNKQLLTEYSIKTVFALEGNDVLELSGKLDKIEFLEDGGIAVVDYKTAKPKSRNEIEGKTKSADGNYKRQLVFYKLLLESGQDFGGKKPLATTKKLGPLRYTQIDFLEPKPNGSYVRENFEIADKEVEELKQKIRKMAKEIMEVSFVGQTCGEDCKYCRLGKLLAVFGNESVDGGLDGGNRHGSR